jgi:hypothetical protein
VTSTLPPRGRAPVAARRPSGGAGAGRLELAQRHLVAIGERVLAVHEEEEVFGEERFDDELGIVDREVDDRRVELAREDSGDDRGRAALADDGMHSGVLGGDGGQELRHEPSGGGADHTDAGIAGHVVVERRDVGGDVVDLVQDASGPLDDAVTLVGEHPVGAVDERDAELALELGDVARDVGLHRVERPGRGRERAVVGDGHDGGELSDVHAGNVTATYRENRY